MRQIVSSVLTVLLFGATFVSVAWAEESSEEPLELTKSDTSTADPHHRLDLGFENFGSGETDVTTFSLGYTWAPGLQHSLHVNANLLNSSLGSTEGDGVSDTLIQYSWAPTETVTAKPWLPRRFGTGLGVLVPTGDLEEDTGVGMWIATPFVGWPFVATKHLVLLPSLLYAHSFGHHEDAVPLRAAVVEFGLLYGFAQRWWVNFLPSLIYEFELDERTTAVFIQLGREIGSRHGVSVEYGVVDDEFSAISGGFGSDVNYRFAIRGHLGFR